MTCLGLRSPQFSEDVAWFPCWLQHLKQEGSNESLKESQFPSKQSVKDLLLSQQNVGDGEDTNALSREEGRYNSCHLFLSGEDSSPVKILPSPGNVFQFSLHFSPDAGSLFFQTQSLDAFNNLVASSTLLSMQQAELSVDFREKMLPAMDAGTCEQHLLPGFFPEIVNKDVSKSPTETIYSVRQHKENSKAGGIFKTANINNAIELSVAATEALAIHNLIKMDSVSETVPTEAVLEVALLVKQARLEGLEDGFHYSNEEFDCSDSLSDLDDFIMTDAYEDVGLHHNVSNEKHFCNSAISQAKDVSVAGNDNGCDNKQKFADILSQHINMDNNSLQKQLDINLDMEMQLRADLPLLSLSCQRQMHFDDTGVGSNIDTPLKNDPPMFHQFKQSDLDFVSIDQTVGLVMVDMPTGKLQNSVNSSEKENWETHLVRDRFRSRWLGGWTLKESDSNLNRTNARQIPKFFIRETSILSESADIAPDVGSVQKDDSKCEIDSQSSVPFDGICNKADEGILRSQHMVTCLNLSLVDPLCSVVPCSISAENANSNTQSDKELDKEKFASSIPKFKVDNFLRSSDQNAAFNSRDDQITPSQDGEDFPTSTSEMPNQTYEKLTSVQWTSRKQLNSLKTYSMIVPNQSLAVECSPVLLSTNHSMSGAVFLDKRSSKGHSALKWAAGNKHKENHEYFINCKSIADITHARSNGINVADVSDIPVEPPQERSPLVLNHRTRRRLLGPKTAVNDSDVEKPLKQHAIPETTVQHQQNNNLPKVQGKCKKFPDGKVKVTKQVRFSESAEQLHRKRTFSKLESSYQTRSSVRAKRQKSSKSFANSLPHMKHPLTNYCRNIAGMKLIFQSIEFMLTGLSRQKERDVEALVRKSGGVILPDVPSPPTTRTWRTRLPLPIIICMTKLQTAKFLYGCAVGASILNVDWLTDCIAAGTILEHEKYMILPNRNDMKCTRIGKAVGQVNQKCIFERVGIMLHGKHSFCIKLAKIVKHGGGQVFKSLQWLVRSIHEERISVGAIVAEDKIRVSRHLNHCALEEKIPVMPCSWIIRSLYSGKLLPFTEESHASPVLIEVPHSGDMNQEI